MKHISVILLLVSLGYIPCASANSPCIEPPVIYSLQHSDAVVVGTVAAVSVRRSGEYWRQTILWHVNESWKGPHYKGSTFTTRTNLPEPNTAKVGQAYLLYLRGKEPYEWQTCSERGGLLQDSLQDVHKLYQEFERVRKLGPNNSFKPNPLRGSA
ncbi:hypothetical protein GCM10022229_22470 [Luteimonas lutimaris]|uniref:Uncharacterized protein n=1 Tax=Luteimonas lutimaris TaxID=698645 RepID=A0ABP7MSW1_9GAMM